MKIKNLKVKKNFSSRQKADQFYENVSLLLKMDGANGSTTFTDSSPTPKTVTRNGSVRLTSAQFIPNYGGVTSAYFDGTGDYLSIPDSAEFNFGTGDFTIELWLYIPTGAAKDKGIIGKGPWPSSSDNSFLFYYGSGGELTFYYSTGSGWTGSSNFTALSTTNTWNHLAVSRSGTNIRTFFNGNLTGTITTSNALATNTDPVLIGSGNAGNNSLNGYIDDIRITKGVARYTANFTPPTESFPDFGPRTFRMPVSQIISGAIMSSTDAGPVFNMTSSQNFSININSNDAGPIFNMTASQIISVIYSTT